VRPSPRNARSAERSSGTDPSRQSARRRSLATRSTERTTASQLIAESADEKTFWTGTEQRRHRSPAGNTIGVTREKKRFWTGTPYRETTRTDGGSNPPAKREALAERQTRRTKPEQERFRQELEGSTELRQIAVALPASGEIL
jgi:hypothetical protein